jgi:regulation of enolase protein 1 (concanavalin A-like superfamily)
MTPYRSSVPARRASFLHLVHAEWTKLRTVRGWVIGLGAAAVVTVLLGLLPSAGSSSHTSCGDGLECVAPEGPGGEVVSDSFHFVHQPLAGDGSITARVTSLTGKVLNADSDDSGDDVEPWAKAGLIVKDSTAQGSTYAAVMVTGDRGVRLQHDFVHDTAGRAGGVSDDAPRWLRLTRSGATVTADESTDGEDWTEVGEVRLADLPATAEIGLFVASPSHTNVDQALFQISESGEPSRATAVFDHVELEGAAGSWVDEPVGDDPVLARLGDVDESADTFTISGSGDIAPVVGGPAAGLDTLEQPLVGTFAGLLVVVVVSTLFVTAEYRRDLILTTLAASPQRGRMLAAKAVVTFGTTFVLGLVAAVVATRLGTWAARSDDRQLLEVSSSTELRVVVGTAALLAVAAVLALAVGTIVRRSAGAVTAVIALTVLPYILATGSVLPAGPADWLLRLTPAAAFSVQQTLVEYAQVSNLYAPANGFFPMAPLAGLAVLCGYAAVALGVAASLLRERDA